MNPVASFRRNARVVMLPENNVSLEWVNDACQESSNGFVLYDRITEESRLIIPTHVKKVIAEMGLPLESHVRQTDLFLRIAPGQTTISENTTAAEAIQMSDGQDLLGMVTVDANNYPSGVFIASHVQAHLPYDPQDTISDMQGNLLELRESIGLGGMIEALDVVRPTGFISNYLREMVAIQLWCVKGEHPPTGGACPCGTHTGECYTVSV